MDDISTMSSHTSPPMINFDQVTSRNHHVRHGYGIRSNVDNIPNISGNSNSCNTRNTPNFDESADRQQTIRRENWEMINDDRFVTEYMDHYTPKRYNK